MLLDITLDSDFLNNISRDTDVCVLHGTHDSVIPLSNSESLVRHIGTATLKTLEGADHSSKTAEEEEVLIDETFRFFAHTY